MEDSLVVEEGIMVKFPSVPFAMCLLHLQLLFQGSFHQEEVKEPNCRYTPNIMNDLGLLRHQLTCHSPHFTVCQNTAIPVARTSKKKQPF